MASASNVQTWTALGIDEVPIELNNSSFDAFISELAPDIVLLFDQFMMEEQFGFRRREALPRCLARARKLRPAKFRLGRHQRPSHAAFEGQ